MIYSEYLQRFVVVKNKDAIRNVSFDGVFDAKNVISIEKVKFEIAKKLICNFKMILSDYKKTKESMLDENSERVITELYSIAIRVHPQFSLHNKMALKIDSKTRTTSKIKNLGTFLSKMVFGQPEAVRTVCEALDCNSAGITDPDKPIGCFLFIGPTGVGKTELAKALAQYMGSIFRVDCAEYAEPHEYAKLIGAPPGYIGYDNGGFFSKLSDCKEHSVVLFDEIEKAHERVHNLLLSIMDDGRITDAKNDLVSFKDCVIIMTSNIGTKECIDLANKIGFNKGNEQALSGQERSEATKKALSRVFKPEFLNRIDEIVLFNSLTVDIARVIFRMLLQKLNKRCKTEMKVSQEAQELVIQHGFSEAYGAREMKRAFRKMIEIPMARQLLLKERNKRFVVEAKDNAISISSEWQQGAVLKGRREV